MDNLCRVNPFVIQDHHRHRHYFHRKFDATLARHPSDPCQDFSCPRSQTRKKVVDPGFLGLEWMK